MMDYFRWVGAATAVTNHGAAVRTRQPVEDAFALGLEAQLGLAARCGSRARKRSDRRFAPFLTPMCTRLLTSG
jgi:hypothetical protein